MNRGLTAAPDLPSGLLRLPASRGAADSGPASPGPSLDTDRIAQLRQHQVALIGKRIEELRRGRLTLSQLAELSQVSVGTLSGLEKGVGNPRFAALNAIARVLEVDVYSLFQSPDVTPAPARRGDRTSVRIQNTGVELELLTPTPLAAQQAGIVAVLIHLPRDRSDRWTEAAATSRMQIEVVLKGTVSYEIDSERHQLSEGDAIMFDASRRHRRSNPSSADTATIFSISRTIDSL